MLSVISAIIYTAVVIIAILLIGLVLVQPSKSGGLGSAFGGVGESVFGAQTMGHLSKITIVMLSLFFVLTLSLAIIAGHRAKTSGLEGSVMQAQAKSLTSGTKVTETSKDVKKTAEVKTLPVKPAASKDVKKTAEVKTLPVKPAASKAPAK